MLDDRRKIGIGLTGLGFLFLFLGVLFFFDKGLIALGNLMFVSGVALTIGPQATLRFFIRKKNLKGSILFLCGVGLVVWGWAIIGMVVETYGFWCLFAGFIPTALSFLRRIPVFGRVLDLPVFKTVLNRIAPAQGLPI
ncbi:g10609 [Coccomyxa viridis]|uniref:G10609 protein n=1 Tax=Coccomyxa viridis TaxID=1274662 RepID=A0ABP1G665_9CHLO